MKHKGRERVTVFEMRRERIPDRAQGRDKGVKESRSSSEGNTKIVGMIGVSKNMGGGGGGVGNGKYQKGRKRSH